MNSYNYYGSEQKWKKLEARQGLAGHGFANLLVPHPLFPGKDWISDALPEWLVDTILREHDSEVRWTNVEKVLAEREARIAELEAAFEGLADVKLRDGLAARDDIKELEADRNRWKALAEETWNYIRSFGLEFAEKFPETEDGLRRDQDACVMCGQSFSEGHTEECRVASLAARYNAEIKRQE